MKIIADMEGILSKQTLEENDVKELTRLVSSLKNSNNVEVNHF